MSYVLLAGFVAVVLGPALLGRGALIDLDILTMFQPFRAIHGTTVVDTITCRGDTIDGMLPGIAAIKHAFFAGDFPTWSTAEVGGAPFASLPNNAPLDPLSLPYFLLPLWLAPAFVKLGEFAVGIAGMVAFLGRLGVSRGAGVLAGIVFVSSGFMLMWTNWPHTRVAALIPVLFWALERLVQERRPRDVAIVGAVVACMLLGGFPAVTVYALSLAGPYVLVRVVQRWRGDARAALGAVGGAAFGVMLGFGLAAVQILPFLRNLDALNLQARDYGASHLPLGLFLTTVAPDSIGLCVAGERYAPVNPIEGVGFLGAAALVLAVAALVLGLPRGAEPDRAPRAFLALAGAVVLTAVWVGGPVLLAIQSLPFYSSNFIGRAQSVFGFIGAVLAGIGIDRLLRWVSPGRSEPVEVSEDDSHRPAGRVAAVRVAAVVAAAVAFATWVVVSAYGDAERDGYQAHLDSAVVVPGLLLAAAIGAVLLTRFGPRRLRIAGPLLLAVLVVGQSAAFAHTMLPLSHPANLYPLTPTHAFLEQHLGPDRYASGDNTMYPATSRYYGMRTPVGHEFTDPRWKDLLLAVDPEVARTRTFSQFTRAVSPLDAGRSPLLDQLAVRYWVASPSRIAGRPDGGLVGRERIRLSPHEHGRCEIRGGALRGVRVHVARSRSVPERGRPILHVAVRTPAGVIEGERLLTGKLKRGSQRVAVVGEALSGGGRYPVDVWLTGARGGTRFRGANGRLSCDAVRPTADGLRLVFAEAGATVYQRLTSLPRIRWASRSEVVGDPATQVRRLTEGVPPDTVLLDDDRTRPAAGEPADVRILVDRPEHMAARVDAGGAGYLVVADSLVRDGWAAEVDGRATALVHGNHAFAAIPVPAGEHRVELAYTAPGLRAGVLVSAVSALLALGLLLVPVLRRRRPRRAVGGSGDGRAAS